MRQIEVVVCFSVAFFAACADEPLQTLEQPPVKPDAPAPIVEEEQDDPPPAPPPPPAAPPAPAVAIVAIKSVNGVAVTTTVPALEPLDDVVLTAAGSVGALSWQILEKPAESSAEVRAEGAGEDAAFFFSSSGVDVLGLDVAGVWRVQVTATGAGGDTAVAEVRLEAIPREGLHVQLSWDVDEDDLDLHLGNVGLGTEDGVAWCSREDCYYDNCADAVPPNWDGVQGYSAGDPRLDIDDTNGFGPENIQIETPVDDSTYLIAVHAYSGEGGAPGFAPTRATVKVFVGGELVQTFAQQLDLRQQLWRVARVHVNAAGTTTVEPLDRVVDDFRCE